MLSAAALARSSGVIAAVASNHPLTSAYCCGPSGGMNSGFSGASRASSSERRTAFSSEASSSSLMVVMPARLPKLDWTTSWRSSVRPLVDTVLRA
jgi:hypothetical protein